MQHRVETYNDNLATGGDSRNHWTGAAGGWTLARHPHLLQSSYIEN